MFKLISLHLCEILVVRYFHFTLVIYALFVIINSACLFFSVNISLNAIELKVFNLFLFRSHIQNNQCYPHWRLKYVRLKIAAFSICCHNSWRVIISRANKNVFTVPQKLKVEGIKIRAPNRPFKLNYPIHLKGKLIDEIMSYFQEKMSRQWFGLTSVQLFGHNIKIVVVIANVLN